MPLDPRKTVFVGGVPRPLKARKYHFCSVLDDDYGALLLLLMMLFLDAGLRLISMMPDLEMTALILF